MPVNKKSVRRKPCICPCTASSVSVWPFLEIVLGICKLPHSKGKKQGEGSFRIGYQDYFAQKFWPPTRRLPYFAMNYIEPPSDIADITASQFIPTNFTLRPLIWKAKYRSHSNYLHSRISTSTFFRMQMINASPYNPLYLFQAARVLVGWKVA